MRARGLHGSSFEARFFGGSSPAAVPAHRDALEAGGDVGQRGLRGGLAHLGALGGGQLRIEQQAHRRLEACENRETGSGWVNGGRRLAGARFRRQQKRAGAALGRVARAASEREVAARSEEIVMAPEKEKSHEARSPASLVLERGRGSGWRRLPGCGARDAS